MQSINIHGYKYVIDAECHSFIIMQSLNIGMPQIIMKLRYYWIIPVEIYILSIITLMIL
jgi:hypothetical protein